MEIKKYQEAIYYLKNRDEITFDGYDYYGEVPYGKSLQYTNSIDTLQELIDICSQPNSIKSKLDHIQDVLACCYETGPKGKILENRWNSDVEDAEEYLRDIKQAYSFRGEDTRIVNELQELLGNCCVDYIKKKVQELMGDLELHKKALELACKDFAFSDIDQHLYTDYEQKYLNEAKEELENGK